MRTKKVKIDPKAIVRESVQNYISHVAATPMAERRLDRVMWPNPERLDSRQAALESQWRAEDEAFDNREWEFCQDLAEQYGIKLGSVA